MTTQSFSLTIASQQINVVYMPNKFGNYGHFEFFSPHEPRRRILISETGYFSHFAPMWEIEEYASPEVYAELVIKALTKSQPQEPKQPEGQQLALF